MNNHVEPVELFAGKLRSGAGQCLADPLPHKECASITRLSGVRSETAVMLEMIGEEAYAAAYAAGQAMTMEEAIALARDDNNILK